MSTQEQTDRDTVPTVRIVDADVDGGFKIINAADKTDDDVLFDDDAPKKRGRPAKADTDAAAGA